MLSNKIIDLADILNNEIVNGDYNQAESDRFWYFTPDAMSDEAVAGLQHKQQSG